jgi:two-component system sensor histidine kinase KdpD
MARTTLDALFVGAGGVIAVSAVVELLPFRMPAEIPALLMLLPITGASVMSSWRVGVPVALLAGVAHALLFIPPRGVIQLGYTKDVLTLVTFCAVAVMVSVLVSRRSIRDHAELIGTERMLLLRSVAHDMRSPLNVILAASTELREGADHDEVSRLRLLGLVVDESRRLDRIVDNMLNLSRLQAGALVPVQQSVELTELLDECVRRFKRVLPAGDQLELGEVVDVEVRVDAVQIDQVLANLVENAVRHGGSPAHVTLRAAVDGRWVRISVDDQGVGFAASARTQLFAPFSSTDNSSGLGLTVCKAIVEAHGGTMSVADSPSGGSSVSFTVPRAD